METIDILKILRKVVEKQMVSFATDSIITTKKLDVNSKVLGKFALENEASDVYVLQNGIYRFNKNWFKHLIVNLWVKKELDKLKVIIGKEIKSTNKLSYSQVIQFLIKNYKESRRTEVPLEPKLVLGSLFKNPELKVPSKLDGKTKALFSFES